LSVPNTCIIPIGSVVKNPENPRIIKDDKFKKLVESVKSFPEMLKLRPVVVDSDMVILGGNMRFEACKAAGYTEIPVIVADSLTEEQKREFIIKDNVSGGEWDWSLLANEWDVDLLAEWGLDLPAWDAGHEANSLSDEEVETDEVFDPIGSASSLHKIVFIFDSPTEGADFLAERLPDVEYKKTCGPAGSIWQVNMAKTYGK